MASSSAPTAHTAPASPSAAVVAASREVPRPPLDLIEAILEDPPTLPGWRASRWRRLLGSGRIDGTAPAALSDPRLEPLIIWAWQHSDHRHGMGAIAAALSAVDAFFHDESSHDDGHGPGDLADWIGIAVASVRSLRKESALPWLLPTDRLERIPADSLPTQPKAESALLVAAARLLAQAGFDLHRNPALATRLTAALDVTIDHWLDGAEHGSGLPAFPEDNRRYFERRLYYKLGADHCLCRLLSGPQPGRGRNREAAWQRGLAYWVALTVAAEHAGGTAPVVPTKVAAHWRKELAALSAPPEEVLSGWPEVVSVDRHPTVVSRQAACVSR